MTSWWQLEVLTKDQDGARWHTPSVLANRLTEEQAKEAVRVLCLSSQRLYFRAIKVRMADIYELTPEVSGAVEGSASLHVPETGDEADV